MYIVAYLSVAQSIYLIRRILHLKGCGVVGLKNLFLNSNKITSAFRGSSLGSKSTLPKFLWLQICSHVPFWGSLQPNGYSSRTPRLPEAMGCPFERRGNLCDSGSPAAVMESEPCRASEGNRSEVDDQSNFADDVEAQSSSSTGISNFSYASQLNTQQTGVVTALSILRSAKRVKLPWETGRLAQVFSRDDFSRRFEIRPQTIGL